MRQLDHGSGDEAGAGHAGEGAVVADVGLGDERGAPRARGADDAEQGREQPGRIRARRRAGARRRRPAARRSTRPPGRRRGRTPAAARRGRRRGGPGARGASGASRRTRTCPAAPRASAPRGPRTRCPGAVTQAWIVSRSASGSSTRVVIRPRPSTTRSSDQRAPRLTTTPRVSRSQSVTTSTVCAGAHVASWSVACGLAGSPEAPNGTPHRLRCAVAEVPHPPRDRAAPRRVAHAGHARGAADAVGVAGQRDRLDDRAGEAEQGRDGLEHGGGRPRLPDVRGGDRPPAPRARPRPRRSRARRAEQPRQRVGHPRSDAEPGVEQRAAAVRRVQRRERRVRGEQLARPRSATRRTPPRPCCRRPCAGPTRAAGRAAPRRAGDSPSARRTQPSSSSALPSSVSPWIAAMSAGANAAAVVEQGPDPARPVRRHVRAAEVALAQSAGRSLASTATSVHRRRVGQQVPRARAARRRTRRRAAGAGRSAARVTTSPASRLSTVPSASATSTRFTGSTQPRRASTTSCGGPGAQQRQQAGEPDVGRRPGRGTGR